MKITIDSANVKIENSKVTIEIDPVQLDTLLKENKVRLSVLKPGDEFKLDNEVFIVLEQTDNGTRVITKKFAYSKIEFGDCNDWRKSPIREVLLGKDYYKKIADIVGKNNIKPMIRDLTSLDGLDDFDNCYDFVSLLTAVEYAKYHKVLGLKVEYPNSWWLITPASTPINGCIRNVCNVFSDGVPRWSYSSLCLGVRPFLNLESSIQVFLNKD